MNNKYLLLAAMAFCALPFVGLSDASATLSAHHKFVAYRSFDKELKETGRFAKMGINVRAFGVCNTFGGLGQTYSQYPAVWIGDGKYDWASLDRQIDDLLSESPDAKFICMIDLNSPPWLQRTLHFDSFDSISNASAAPLWISKVSEWLAAVIAHCEAKCGERMLAYGLMAGQTTEWFEEVGTFRLTGFKNAAWRKWCAKRKIKNGGTSVPDDYRLSRASFEGVMYDPATELDKIEYWRFNNSLVADAIIEFAKVAKRAAPNREIGAFYGYYNICNGLFASSCHLDYSRVLACKDFDFLISPATYTERGCGYGTETMTVPGTLRRFGKRFLHEIDFWPHNKLVWFKYSKYWHSLAETIVGNTREVAYAFANNASYWWFDQKGGFYAFPEMYERITKLTEIGARLHSDESAPLADVLVVADPDSMYYAPDRGIAQNNRQPRCPDGFAPIDGCAERLPNILNRIGVVVDLCSFDDLPHLDLTRIKAVFLPASWTLTPAKANVLKDYVLKNGRTIIWTYAPGVCDGKTIDANRVKDWAGVPFKTKEVSVTAMDDWTAVYAYRYDLLTHARCRQIVANAGCHLWTDEMLPVVANGRMFSIHAAKGGEKNIRLPFKCKKVVDSFSGKIIAENVTEFKAVFSSPDTKIFEYWK